MKINPAKLTLEDFPEQRSWIGKLFTVLNTFTGDLVVAFANRLSVADNLFQEIRDVKWVNTPIDYPLKFRTKFAQAPRLLLVGYLFDHTTNAYSPLQPWVNWAYQDGQIVISNISGLTADTTYTIRMLLIYE